MSFQTLKEILNQVRKRYPALSKRLREAEALARWEKAVGPMIAKHSRAIRIQDGVLWVEVDHPIWKSELHYRKRQILDLLNAKTETTPPHELAKLDGSGSPKAAPFDAIEDLFLVDARPSRKLPSSP